MVPKAWVNALKKHSRSYCRRNWSRGSRTAYPSRRIRVVSRTPVYRSCSSIWAWSHCKGDFVLFGLIHLNHKYLTKNYWESTHRIKCGVAASILSMRSRSEFLKFADTDSFKLCSWPFCERLMVAFGLGSLGLNRAATKMCLGPRKRCATFLESVSRFFSRNWLES